MQRTKIWKAVTVILMAIFLTASLIQFLPAVAATPASTGTATTPAAPLESPPEDPSFSVEGEGPLGFSGADILQLASVMGNPPVVAIPAASLGLDAADDIDALSYGWDASDSSTEPVLECLGFEDLALGTVYYVGDTFVTSGVAVTAKSFVWSDGTVFPGGSAWVGNVGLAGGSDQEMAVNNINLGFDFGGSISGLELKFGEYGGNLNIEINGDFRNFDNFADLDGLAIGGVDISVVDGLGNDQGTLSLSGTINSFTIGGQELWIDDACPGAEEPQEPEVLNFSVRPQAAGLPGTAVAAEASCDPPQAAGDEFVVPLPGQNEQVLDEDGIACSSNTGYPIGLTLEDDLDALNRQSAAYVDPDGNGIPDAPVYFSLAPGSPSLTLLGATPAHILVSQGGGPPLVFATPEQLGLQAEDDVDGIALVENGNGVFDPSSDTTPEGDFLVFSLAEGSPTLVSLGGSPGDLFVPNKGTPGGPPMRAFPSSYLGLARADDLNALKGEASFLWEPAPFPEELPLPEPSGCVVNPIGGSEGWSPRAPLPLEREGGFAVIIGDRIYVGHGVSRFGDDNFHFIYHIPTDTWHSAAPAPIGRAEATGVCAEEDGQAKVFVIGGRYGGVLDDVLVYDPLTNSWSPRTPMPTPRAGLGAAWVPSLNTIFVVGGRDGSIPHSGVPLDVVEAYDVSAGTWSTMAPMPIPLMDVYSTVYDPGTHRIYVIGGFDGTSVSDAVQIYDIATDTWSLGAPMPTPRSNLLAGLCGGRIHAIGGYAGPAGTPAPGPEYDVNEAYDPVLDTWITGFSPLPEPRSEFMTQGVSTGQEIYAIGDGIHGDPGYQHDVYVCGAPNEPPHVASFQPYGGSGRVGQWVDFTTIYTDANGYEDINWAFFFLDHQPPIASGGLVAAYFRAWDLLWLKDGGVCTPGDSMSLSTAYVTLDCQNSSVSGTGDTLTINWRVRPERCFEGGCGWNYAIGVVADSHGLRDARLMGWWRLVSPVGTAQEIRRAVKPTEADLERLTEEIDAWQLQLRKLH